MPAAIVLALSFSQAAASVPPYDPLVTWDGWWPSLHLFGDNYATLVAGRFLPVNAALQSLLVASVSSVLCLLIGYPMALAIARAPERWRSLLLLLVMLPFWTGFLLRIVAWIGLLGDDGWINAALLAVGVIGAPLHMLYTRFAMYVGDRILLPAVHGAAAVCAAVQAGPGAGGGGRRPWGGAVAGVPDGDAAVVAAGRSRRGWRWCSCRRWANT